MRTAPARLFTPLLAALACPPLAHAQEALERVRAAVGTWVEEDTALEGRGRARASGTDGTLRVVLSSSGAFRIDFDSPLPEAAGFDGTSVWMRDHTGLGRRLELEEADSLKLFSWVLSGHWLDTVEVEVRPIEGEEGSLALRLAGAPMEMTLVLDPLTHLPGELVEHGAGYDRRWIFGDHAEVAGRRLAWSWTLVEEDTEETYRLEDLRSAQVDPALFRPLLDRPDDVRFDPEEAAEIEAESAPSGHLLVEARVDDQDLGAFLFDTGAGITVIDESVADELDLEVLGSTIAVGVAGATTTRYRRGTSLQVGPVTIRAPVYGDLDLGFIQAAFGGRKIAGIVGYDLLARCVVELEGGSSDSPPRVALFDPATYTLANGSWQDLVLHENHPCVSARFEGEYEALFRLDTGAGGTVTFHAPTVARLDLLAGRKVSAGHSGGVGGSAPAPRGEIAWFELAGHRFESPNVAFSQATMGALTDPYLAGNIGQGFLRPFRVVLDYRNDRLALVGRR